MSLTPLAPLLPFHKRANVESLWDTAKAGTTLKKRAKRRKNIERLALATKKKAAKISSKAGDNITLNQSPAKFLNLDCEDPDVTKTFLTWQPAPVGIISMKSQTHFRIRAVAATAVFVLSLATATAATTNVIFSFGEGEGEYADTDLETDSAGNIYGTTVLGGDFGSGTVFKLSPTPTGWVHTVLYSFTSGADGGEPYKGVTLDREGNLYGTAVTGGSGSCEGGCGVVYKLTNSGGTWTQTVIHAFTGGDDGSGPGARVTLDSNGNVYGMAPTGGAYGLGTIYKIHQEHNGAWNFKVIHAFTGGADGATGSAGRMILRHGHLYGAATAGGTYGSGVVFELAPRGIGEWNFRTIYSFRGQPDGSFPYGALLFDRSGNIYGTTYYGGANGIGAVYELSPRPIGEWNESVLYSFQEGTDGNSPIGNLVSDNAGNLYGTTSEGGLGSGTIFKLSPVGGGQWVETIVHPFEGPPDGAFAYNGMVVDRFGNFYGATVHGGDNDDGAIYKFTP